MNNTPKPVYIGAERGQITLNPGTIVKGIPYYGMDTPCMYIGFRKGKRTTNNAVPSITALAFVSIEKILPHLTKWYYRDPTSGNRMRVQETRFYLLPDLPYDRFMDLNEIELVDSTPLAQRTDLF